MSRSQRYQKILVIATHCIGDSLLITTFTRSLRKAYPNAQIDVLVNARGEMVFGTNPDVDNLVEIPPRPSLRDFFALRKQHGRYDLVVNEMLNDRTAIYSWFFGKQRIGAVDENLPGAWFKKWVFTHYIRETHNFEHKMSRMARILDLIDVDIEPQLVSPEAPLPESVSSCLPEQYVVVHAPSSNEIKQWPVHYWIKTVEQLLSHDYHVVLTGAGERDEQIVAQIVEQVPTSARLINVVGQLSLAQTSTLLKRSQGFVGPDSGPGHMASGYPIPIVSIISVAPASMWSPWPYHMPVERDRHLYQNGTAKQIQGNVTLLQSQRSCVPCYKNKCQISDDLYSPCLTDIQPEQVVEAVFDAIPIKVVN